MKGKLRQFLVKLFSLILVIVLAIPSQIFASTTSRKRNTYDGSTSIMGLASGASTEQVITDIIDQTSEKEEYRSDISTEETDEYIIKKQATINVIEGEISYKIEVLDKNPTAQDPSINQTYLTSVFAVNANAAHRDIIIDDVKHLDENGEEYRVPKGVSRPNLIENTKHIQTVGIKTVKPQYGVVYYLSSRLDVEAKKDIRSDKFTFALDMVINDHDQYPIYEDRYALRLRDEEENDASLDTPAEISADTTANLVELTPEEKTHLIDGIYIEEINAIVSYVPATVKWSDFIFPETDQNFRYYFSLDDKQDTTDAKVRLEFYEAKENGFVINNSYTQHLPYTEYLDIAIPKGQFARVVFTTTVKKDPSVRNYTFNNRKIPNLAFDIDSIGRADGFEDEKAEEEDPLPEGASGIELNSYGLIEDLKQRDKYDQNAAYFIKNTVTSLENYNSGITTYEQLVNAMVIAVGVYKVDNVVIEETTHDLISGLSGDKYANLVAIDAKKLARDVEIELGIAPANETETEVQTETEKPTIELADEFKHASGIALNKEALLTQLEEEGKKDKNTVYFIKAAIEALENYNIDLIDRDQLVETLAINAGLYKIDQETIKRVIEGLTDGLSEDKYENLDGINPEKLAKDIYLAATTPTNSVKTETLDDLADTEATEETEEASEEEITEEEVETEEGAEVPEKEAEDTIDPYKEIENTISLYKEGQISELDFYTTIQTLVATNNLDRNEFKEKVSPIVAASESDLDYEVLEIMAYDMEIEAGAEIPEDIETENGLEIGPDLYGNAVFASQYDGFKNKKYNFISDMNAIAIPMWQIPTGWYFDLETSSNIKVGNNPVNDLKDRNGNTIATAKKRNERTIRYTFVKNVARNTSVPIDQLFDFDTNSTDPQKVQITIVPKAGSKQYMPPVTVYPNSIDNPHEDDRGVVKSLYVIDRWTSSQTYGTHISKDIGDRIRYSFVRENDFVNTYEKAIADYKNGDLSYYVWLRPESIGYIPSDSKISINMSGSGSIDKVDIYRVPASDTETYKSAFKDGSITTIIPDLSKINTDGNKITHTNNSVDITLDDKHTAVNARDSYLIKVTTKDVKANVENKFGFSWDTKNSGRIDNLNNPYSITINTPMPEPNTGKFTVIGDSNNGRIMVVKENGELAVCGNIRKDNPHQPGVIGTVYQKAIVNPDPSTFGRYVFPPGKWDTSKRDNKNMLSDIRRAFYIINQKDWSREDKYFVSQIVMYRIIDIYTLPQYRVSKTSPELHPDVYVEAKNYLQLKNEGSIWEKAYYSDPTNAGISKDYLLPKVNDIFYSIPKNKASMSDAEIEDAVTIKVYPSYYLTNDERALDVQSVITHEVKDGPKQPTAGFKIKKVGSDNKSATLAGAEFTLTKQADNSFIPIVRSTSAADGKGQVIEFNNLKPGTYILTETGIPAGYNAHRTNWDIVITNDGKVNIGGMTNQPSGIEYTIENPKEIKIHGSIRLQKVSTQDRNRGLAGAVFEISKNPSMYPVLDTSIATDDNGYVEFNNLEPSTTYYIREKQAPSQFVKNNDIYYVSLNEKGQISTSGYQNSPNSGLYSVETGSQKYVRVQNKPSDKPTAEFEIKKVDSKTGASLANAEFELRDINNNIVDKSTTGFDGKIKFTNIPEGTYKLIETKAPTGYKTGVNSNNTTITVDNKAYVTITYTDSKGNQVSKDGSGRNNQQQVLNNGNTLIRYSNPPRLYIGNDNPVGHHSHGIYDLLKGEGLYFDADFDIINGKPGEKFSITFDDRLDLALWSGQMPNIVGHDGTIIATPKLIRNNDRPRKGYTLEYTLANTPEAQRYFASYKNIRASIHLTGLFANRLMTLDHDETRLSRVTYMIPETYTYTFDYNGTKDTKRTYIPIKLTPTLSVDGASDNPNRKDPSIGVNVVERFEENGEQYFRVVAYYNRYAQDRNSGKLVKGTYKDLNIPYSKLFVTWDNAGIPVAIDKVSVYQVQPKASNNSYANLSNEYAMPGAYGFWEARESKNNSTVTKIANNIDLSTKTKYSYGNFLFYDKNKPYQSFSQGPLQFDFARKDKDRNNRVDGYIVEMKFKITDPSTLEEGRDYSFTVSSELFAQYARGKVTLNTGEAYAEAIDNKPIEIEIPNDLDDSKPGQIVINKIDDKKNPLPGAQFTLYKNGNPKTYVDSRTSGMDGKVTFNNLYEGTYTLEETSPPEGHDLGSKSSWEFRVDKNGNVTGELTSSQQTAETVVNKNDYLITNPLGPIAFSHNDEVVGAFNTFLEKVDGSEDEFNLVTQVEATLIPVNRYETVSKAFYSGYSYKENSYPKYMNTVQYLERNPSNTNEVVYYALLNPRTDSNMDKDTNFGVTATNASITDVQLYNVDPTKGLYAGETVTRSNEAQAMLEAIVDSEFENLDKININNESRKDNQVITMTSSSNSAKIYIPQTRFATSMNNRSNKFIVRITANVNDLSRDTQFNIAWENTDPNDSNVHRDSVYVAGAKNSLRGQITLDVNSDIFQTLTPSGSPRVTLNLNVGREVQEHRTRVKLKNNITPDQDIYAVNNINISMSGFNQYNTSGQAKYYHPKIRFGSTNSTTVGPGSLTVENKPIKPVEYSLKILKESNVLNSNGNYDRLPKAGFTLTGPDNDSTIRPGTTNSSGEIIFEKLKPGTYTLKETKAPDGYIASGSEWSVVITDDGKVYSKELQKISTERGAVPPMDDIEVESGAPLFDDSGVYDDSSFAGLEMSDDIISNRVSASAWQNVDPSRSDAPSRNSANNDSNDVATKIIEIDKVNKRFRQRFLLNQNSEILSKKAVFDIHRQPLTSHIGPDKIYSYKIQAVGVGSTIDNIKGTPEDIKITNKNSFIQTSQDNFYRSRAVIDGKSYSQPILVEIETDYEANKPIGLGIDFYPEGVGSAYPKKVWLAESYSSDTVINYKNNNTTPPPSGGTGGNNTLPNSLQLELVDRNSSNPRRESYIPNPSNAPVDTRITEIDTTNKYFKQQFFYQIGNAGKNIRHIEIHSQPEKFNVDLDGVKIYQVTGRSLDNIGTKSDITASITKNTVSNNGVNRVVFDIPESFAGPFLVEVTNKYQNGTGIGLGTDYYSIKDNNNYFAWLAESYPNEGSIVIKGKDPVVTKEQKRVTVDLPQPADIRNSNPNMLEGTQKVVKQGYPGYRIDIYEYTYNDGVQSGEGRFVKTVTQVDGVATVIEYGIKPKEPEKTLDQQLREQGYKPVDNQIVVIKNTPNEIKFNKVFTKANNSSLNIGNLKVALVNTLPTTGVDKNTAYFSLKDASGNFYNSSDYASISGTQLIFKKLPAGRSYTLSELKAPDGFAVEKESVTFRVEANGNIIGPSGINQANGFYNLNNKEVTNKFYIKKVDATNGNKPLSNVAFTLFDATKQNKLGSASTNADGEIYFSNVLPGTYYLKETSPQGYYADSIWTTIVVGHDNVIAVNADIKVDTTKLQEGSSELTDANNKTYVVTVTNGKIVSIEPKATETTTDPDVEVPDNPNNNDSNTPGNTEPVTPEDTAIRSINVSNGLTKTIVRRANGTTFEAPVQNGVLDIGDFKTGQYRVEDEIANKIYTINIVDGKLVDQLKDGPLYEDAKWTSNTTYVQHKLGWGSNGAWPDYMNAKSYTTVDDSSSGQVVTYVMLKPRRNQPGEGGTNNNTNLRIKVNNSTISNIQQYEIGNGTNKDTISKAMDNGDVDKYIGNASNYRYPLKNNWDVNSNVFRISLPVNYFYNDNSYVLKITSKMTNPSVEGNLEYLWYTDSNLREAYIYYTETLPALNTIKPKKVSSLGAYDVSLTATAFDRIIDFIAPTAHAASVNSGSNELGFVQNQGVWGGLFNRQRAVESTSNGIVMTSTKPSGFDTTANTVYSITISNYKNEIVFEKSFSPTDKTKDASKYSIKVVDKLPEKQDEFVAYFELVKPEGATATPKQGLGANQFGWEKLSPGTYTLKELVPIDFKPASSITFTVEDDNNIYFDNKIVTKDPIGINNTGLGRGKIIVNKTGDKNEPLNGVTFAIYNAKFEKIGESVTGLDSNPNGQAIFTNLPYGNYFVKEIKGPEGYILDPEFHEVVLTKKNDIPDPTRGRDVSKEFNVEASISLRNKLNEIEFEKRESYVSDDTKTDDAKPIFVNDAEFRLYIDNNGTKAAYDNQTYRPNNGKLYWKGLKPGNYELVETKAGNGYVEITDDYQVGNSTIKGKVVAKFTVKITGEIEVDKDSSTVIENDRYGKFKIAKIDGKTNAELDNAKFKLTKLIVNPDDNSKLIPDVTAVRNIDFSKSTIVDKIAPGKYILEEAEAPKGYSKTDFKWIVEVKRNGVTTITPQSDESNTIEVITNVEDRYSTNVSEIKVKNNPAGKFKLHKVAPKNTSGEEADNDNILDNSKQINLNGVEFSLINSANKYIKEDGTVSEEPYSAKTNNGVIEFTNLSEGNYTLIEETPADGYIPIFAKWTVNVSKDGTTTIKTKVEDGEIEPTGYNVSQDVIKGDDLSPFFNLGYAVANANGDDQTTIKVVNKRPSYPATGGPGMTIAFALIGTAVMLTAIAYYGIYINDKKRRRSNRFNG